LNVCKGSSADRQKTTILKIANDCFRVVLAVFGGAVTYFDASGGPSLVIFLRCFTVWENGMHGLTRWLAENTLFT